VTAATDLTTAESAFRARLAAVPLWVAAAAVGLCAALLMSIRLDRRSFWTDEAVNVVLVRDGWLSLLRTIGDHEPSQAVYLVLLKPWIAVVGQAEWLVRLPSVLFGAAAVALTVVLGTMLMDRLTGVVAGLVLATNAAFIEWSQYARTYSLAVLASVATTIVFVLVLRSSGSSRAWLGYGALGAVSVYCHFFAGFVLVAQAVAALVRDGRAALGRLALAWAVILIGLIPFAAYVVRGSRNQVEWIPEPGAGQIWNSVHFAAGLNAVILVGAIAGAILLARSDRGRWTTALVVGWAVLPLLEGLLVSVVHPALVPRFLLVTAPALALLTGYALTRLPPAGTLLGLVLIIAVSGWRLTGIYDRPPHDWERAGNMATDAYHHGTDVAVAPSFAWRDLALYAPDVQRVIAPTGRPLLVLVWASTDEQVRAATTPLIGASGYRLISQTHIGTDIRVQRWQPPASP